MPRCPTSQQKPNRVMSKSMGTSYSLVTCEISTMTGGEVGGGGQTRAPVLAARNLSPSDATALRPFDFDR